MITDAHSSQDGVAGRSPLTDAARASTRTSAVLAASAAATNPAGASRAADSPVTPCSRARQRLACPHQLARSRSPTPWAAAHALAFCPDASYASTTARQLSIRSRSFVISAPASFNAASFPALRSTVNMDSRNAYDAAVVVVDGVFMRGTEPTTARRFKPVLVSGLYQAPR